MKNVMFLFAFFFLSFSTTWAQESETRKLDAFTAIAVKGSLEVVIKKGNKESVYIETKNVDLDKILTEVKKGQLTIEQKRGKYKNTNIKIIVTYNQLNEVAIAGSGQITTDGNLVSDNLDIAIAGSGDFKGSVAADKIDVEIAGSGGVEVNGKTDELNISIAGSGDYEGEELKCQNADISIAGSGNVRVWVENKIKGSIAGSGDIYYKGKSPKVSIDKMGSGKIEKIN